MGCCAIGRVGVTALERELSARAPTVFVLEDVHWADEATLDVLRLLARLAVEQSVPPHRKVGLHRRALAALADPPRGVPDLARLAHHAEAAGDVDAVLRFAPAAADRAVSLGAYREAAAQYARALRFGDRGTAG